MNIAEGTEKNQRADRARFYSNARRSAMECAAICDILGLVDPRLLPQREIAKAKLKSIVSTG